MPARRTSSAAARSLCSSWQSVAFIAFVVFQVFSIYLLINLASRQQDRQLQDTTGPLGTRGKQAGGAGAGAGYSRRDRVLSVHGVPPPACVPQTISAGRCSDEARGVRKASDRETCAFDLEESDIVFGVWHSLATEARLQPLLDTWGTGGAQIVLLASSLGVMESKLFKEGVPGSRPHLMDTGIEQDDYFSTLGKAFIGLRLMLESYPTKKWFVVLGDDNYVLLDNYVNVLSAFDPEEPWALSRVVHRQKFGCKVAGGASVITSRAMTQELAPHLEPWYQGVVERSGGDVKKAEEQDKFHDISFQKLVEHIGHSWTHLDELPHEPPGFYFDPRLGTPKAEIPERSALFHYVPGKYMHYLHFASSLACTCALPAERVATALSEVAVGVYSPFRRLSKLDEKRIAATWGKKLPRRRLLESSGRDYTGLKGDVARLRELTEAFPDAGWLLLLPVEHYVIATNLAVRVSELDRDTSAGRGVMVYGPTGIVGGPGRFPGGAWEYSENFAGEGALLVGKILAETIFSFEMGLVGGLFPISPLPGDRVLVAWARTLNSVTVLEDAGLARRLPGPGWKERGEEVGCPATFPMDPDLADLKPEFTISEGGSVMFVTQYLLRTSTERECSARLRSQEL